MIRFLWRFLGYGGKLLGKVLIYVCLKWVQQFTTLKKVFVGKGNTKTKMFYIFNFLKIINDIIYLLREKYSKLYGLNTNWNWNLVCYCWSSSHKFSNYIICCYWKTRNPDILIHCTHFLKVCRPNFSDYICFSDKMYIGFIGKTKKYV